MPGKYAGTAWIVASALTENITTQHQPLLLGTALFGFEPVVPLAIWMAFPSTSSAGRLCSATRTPRAAPGTASTPGNSGGRDCQPGFLPWMAEMWSDSETPARVSGRKKKSEAAAQRTEDERKATRYCHPLASCPGRDGWIAPRLLLGRNNRSEPLAPY
jgi:hypothetical protein